MNSPDRLTKPLIRVKDKPSGLDGFREASWEEAISLITTKLNEIKNKYSPDAIGVFSSAKCSNEENYLLQKFARVSIGTNNVDHCARLCHASSVSGMGLTLGSAAMTDSLDGLLKSDVIFVIGENVIETQPVTAIYIKKAVKENGAVLIVADPRKVGLVDFADTWINHKVGTDSALLNGIANVIIEKGLINEEFIKNRTEGYDEFLKTIKKYTPEYVSKITGVAKEVIIEVAIKYAKAKNAFICWGMGITQHSCGTDNVFTLVNLAILTGQIGREGAGLAPLRGQNNVQGACDMGALPDVLPGYQKISDANIREKFGKVWGKNIPEKPGLTATEMIHLAHDKKMKAFYMMGENVVLSDPNMNFTIEALKKLEFLVVQDIFLSETAEFADVVLPAASFAEKNGTFTNTERRVQRLDKAIDSPCEAKEDWEIICLVSKAFGYDMNYSSSEQIMSEIGTLVPSYAGISYTRLAEKGLQWPCPSKEHPGTQILHTEKFPIGKGKFTPVEYKPPYEEPNNEYPFILITGRILYHYHTGTMTRKVEGLNILAPVATIEVHTKDAQKLGCKDKDIVKVSSKRGTIKATVKITDNISQGTVFTTFHYKESAANLLTIDALDPIAKIPEYKACAVKIEK